MPIVPVGLNLASAAVVFAFLYSTLGLELWSVKTAPKYLKLSTSSKFSPLILMSMLMPLVMLVISLVFSKDLLFSKGCGSLIQAIH